MTQYYEPLEIEQTESNSAYYADCEVLEPITLEEAFMLLGFENFERN